jgi:hypothetical protein
LISGGTDRRRRALFWSTIASAAIHLLVLTTLFYAIARLFVPQGSREVVAQTSVVKIERRVVATPAPARAVRNVRRHEPAPAATPRRELAKQVAQAPPQPPRQPTLPSRLERDAAGFANEVARLNRQDDPHAIPTIDPASRGSATKSYQFDVASLSSGEEHGNGIITPTQSWRDGGLDCYYGRYEFTYPDGAMESGAIVWPFCFNPGSDPFKQGPHLMPFPLPLVGYRLPPDTQLPPIEKAVYEQWAAANPSARSTP